MKIKLTTLIIVAVMFVFAKNTNAQAPSLGTAAGFVLFSSNGAVSNSGISHLTGNVGSNNGSSTAFGNVNGTMNDQNALSAQCAADIIIAYNQISASVPTFFPSTLLGNGDTLIAGIYSLSAATTINGILNLDALGDPNAIFIFKIQGTLETGANTKVRLLNGALACNVFWATDGAVNIAAGSFIRGTIIANNAAIEMNALDTLEGRALSTTGSVAVDGVLAYTPIGCGSPILTGPAAPNLKSTECYALFSSIGAVTNTGISTISSGDIGTNDGLTTGFDSLLVNGTIHLIPDTSTAQAAIDLLSLYNEVNVMPYDIELLYPAQFGRNLVLTPHVYLMNAAASFTDTLYLNALGNADAVFVIQINGALTTSTYAKVLLINGAQAKNVYWKIEGAVDINNYSIFCGTIICNNGALGALNTGVVLNGRALITSGALTTNAINAIMPLCTTTGVNNTYNNNEFIIYPNPFNTSLTIKVVNEMNSNYKFKLYNVLGAEVLAKDINQAETRIVTEGLAKGIYFYNVINNNHISQTGKLVLQ